MRVPAGGKLYASLPLDKTGHLCYNRLALEQVGGNMEHHQLYTTAKLVKEARRRGILLSRERVRQLCESGAIRAIKPGRDWLIEPADAERWLRNRQESNL